MSTKGLTKDLINKVSILNFSSGIFQNYLVFIPHKNTLNVLTVLIKFICGNLLSQHAIFREHSLFVPSALQCSGHPGKI